MRRSDHRQARSTCLAVRRGAGTPSKARSSRRASSNSISPNLQRHGEVRVEGLVRHGTKQRRSEERRLKGQGCVHPLRLWLLQDGRARPWSRPSLALDFCRRGASSRSNLLTLWWSCSARAMATVIRSCLAHERSRRSLLRRAEVPPRPANLKSLRKRQRDTVTLECKRLVVVGGEEVRTVCMTNKSLLGSQLMHLIMGAMSLWT